MTLLQMHRERSYQSIYMRLSHLSETKELWNTPSVLQELAPYGYRRLPGFIGLVPPPTLDKNLRMKFISRITKILS
ncbi:hypothetical protein J2Z69_003235 [Paenibacillus shirakamiensis]|uniref:Uncharacterized protein n=1 Tax=Paenibacillus shirakamiensis TaxID=1265935 RepID=A0ABS4JKD6_9BACL|nr:hypothetical protein [Paenibacillus shirakamiensis]